MKFLYMNLLKNVWNQQIYLNKLSIFKYFSIYYK